MRIEADDNAKEPRLIVPKSLAGSAKPTSVPHSNQHGEGPIVPLPLCIAFTLSFGGIGLCLMCGRTIPRVLLMLLAIGVAGGAVVWADTPQPLPHNPTLHSPILPLDGVTVEFVEVGDTIRLILPRPMVAEMAKKLNASEVR
jgi:hypothetical protein